ncbi:3-deoxy-7-phosphoheptulonate synthase [candidate division KSB1 bacterium]|nr:3-deoxy-7-phosphoheptulonate synthase [candidate division KSB1 bacterium]RQW03808.1 MAG: 3-deoxy-7-phosphoheptulonate synthase [candidate division KSB1 bacterium]
MVIVMRENATEQQIQDVTSKLHEFGLNVHKVVGTQRTILGAIGDVSNVDHRAFKLMDGVFEVHRISEPYKLAGRIFHAEDTIIRVGDAVFGGNEVTVIAGPCSIESAEQLLTIAKAVKAAGAKVLRGGAFKPRTSPYAFQGLGVDGLKLLKEVSIECKIPTVSEVMRESQLDLVAEYVDILQVGARNMQNFPLLIEIGKTRKPVLLKRGMSARIEELLMAAEYIMAGGNYQIILCERGIRTFENYTRNTLDLSAIPVVKKLSHLPIIADPSHGTGLRNKVAPMARAAVAAGADGLLIEVHHDPEHALSDGPQSLLPQQFVSLMEQVRMIASAIGRKIE